MAEDTDAELERYLDDPRFHRAWERFGQSSDDITRKAVSSLASANLSGDKITWDEDFDGAVKAGKTQYDGKPYDPRPFMRMREIANWIFRTVFDLNPDKADKLASELERHAVTSTGLDWGKHQAGSRIMSAFGEPKGTSSSDTKIKREAFLYLGASQGSKQCGACYAYAKDQKLCALMGKNQPGVLPGHTCGVYLKGSYDTRMPIRELAKPEEIAYYQGLVQCQRCKYGGDRCALYVMLNKAFPDIFDLEEKIEGEGCCDAWTEKVGSNGNSPDRKGSDGNQATNRS